MEVREKSDISHIHFLPDEIISSIFFYSELPDVVNFSASCKRFNKLLRNSNCFWKERFKQLIPLEFQKLVTQNKDYVDWLYELKQFYLLKKNVISELIKMSQQFYWRETEVSLEDLKPFFKIATTTYINYYYTVYVLQEIVSKTKVLIDNNTCIKPVNTLTTLYYTKIVLRYLIQTYLCIKWVSHVTQHELTPELEVNFFVQWIDPDNMHTDEEMEEKILYLANEVKAILKESDSSKSNNKSSKPRTEREILCAISEVIYNRQKIIALSLDTGSTTLDIVKVVDEKRGSVITLGTIYQAVAKELGVQCELNAFSDHFFLEWLSNESGNSRVYTIDLTTGELRPKRQCPFSHQSNLSSHRYHPGSMIQFLYSLYMQSKGTVADWEYQNASLLFDFLASHEIDNLHNPYKDFFLFLSRYAVAPTLNPDINMKSLAEEHRNLIMMLSELNEPQESVEHVIIKKRKSDLKYAVGMVCYHIQHYYTFVISGWEVDDARKPKVNDSSDDKQPIYTVVTEDQCVKFIPQEKIKQLSKPHRIKSVEDLLGRDFTHFDGFAYVSNDEKMKEYPEDRCIVEEYINRCFTRNN